MRNRAALRAGFELAAVVMILLFVASLFAVPVTDRRDGLSCGRCHQSHRRASSPESPPILTTAQNVAVVMPIGSKKFRRMYS